MAEILRKLEELFCGGRCENLPICDRIAVLAYDHIVTETFGDYRIRHTALDVLVDRQVETAEQLHLADQNQVMVLGKTFQQQPQLAKVFHVHQMGIVNDGDEHLAAAIQSERLLDQFAFTLER